MEDQRQRLTKCISTPELERRWKAVRAKMKEKKIDYLVMQNSEEYMGGTIRWFTDFSARHQFPMTVIFPVDDEMTTIVCGVNPLEIISLLPGPLAALKTGGGLSTSRLCSIRMNMKENGRSPY